MCNRVLIMYQARSSAAFCVSGWRSLSSSSQLKSYYLTQQEQIGGQSVSGAFQNWCELRQRARSHVISCQRVLVCVWGGFDLLAQFVLSLSSELENVLMNSPSSFSLSFCRIGREWSVSLSYSGWPWLWFAVSLNKDATLLFQLSFRRIVLVSACDIIPSPEFNFTAKVPLLEKYDFAPMATILNFLAVQLQHIEEF